MLRLGLADLRDAGFDDDELAGIFANPDKGFRGILCSLVR